MSVTTQIATVRRSAASAVTAATVVAVVLAGTTVAGTGTAHAGAVCTVAQHYAPIYEHNSTQSRVIGRIAKGLPVAATRLPEWELWRVSRADNGAHLGYMTDRDLDCSAG